MKGTFRDAVADRVSDRIGFAEQPRGSAEEPACKNKYCRGYNQVFRGGSDLFEYVVWHDESIIGFIRLEIKQM